MMHLKKKFRESGRRRRLHLTHLVPRERPDELGHLQVPNLERARLRTRADDLLRVAEANALNRSRVAAKAL